MITGLFLFSKKTWNISVPPPVQENNDTRQGGTYHENQRNNTSA